MSLILGLLLIAALGACGFVAYLWWTERTRLQASQEEAERRMAELKAAEELAKKATEDLRQKAIAHTRQLEANVRQLQERVAALAKWESVEDADVERTRLLLTGQALMAQAEADAERMRADAKAHYDAAVEQGRAEVKSLTSTAREELDSASEQSKRTIEAARIESRRIVAEANTRAEEIAGKAYDVVRNAEFYEQTVRAMKNIIAGYGDEYLKPAASLLDDLAAEFGHKDAGIQLKLARENTKALVKERRSATCQYVEANRRDAAEDFVTDAFNGKVDSVLSRVKHDNFGKLEQEIRDAFTMVNFNGAPFRDARVREEYLESRLAELRWAAVAQELKRQEQVEQRMLREQIREEEKARREYEKAMREAAKEEELLRKAMLAAQAQIATATEEQRSKYEAQLAELSAKLTEAEERNIRAISMAQQTRRGHVYIISNVGSFGESVYKIGLTRRLEPLDRIKELGDASVPFDFDVHAILWSEDAPALESTLHKQFVLNRLNKVNHRKEFFRANLADIRQEIETLGVECKWTMLAEAQQYRESLAIEKAIAENPAAREAWVNRQFVLEDYAEGEAVAAEVGDDEGV